MPDTLNTRWAYTALDYKNSQNAVPDEIMIDKTNGQIWYKRPDSQIVTYTPPVTDSGLTEIAIAISHSTSIQITESNDFELRVPTTAGSLLGTIQYPAVDVFGDGTLSEVTIQTDGTLSNVGGPSSLSANAFFLKVEPRSSDIDYIELLTSLYNYQNSRGERGNCKVTYSVTYSNSIALSVTKQYTQDIVIHEMTAIRIPLPGDPDIDPAITELGDLASIRVTVNSLSFEYLLSVLSPSTQINAEPYMSVMNTDQKIVISNIYLSTFVDRNSDFGPIDTGEYHAFYACINVQDRVDNTGGLSPEDQEKIDQIIETIENMTSTIYSYTSPGDGDIPKGATYYQLFDVGGLVPDPGPTDGLNVTYTNLTTDINEIKKWFADFLNGTYQTGTVSTMSARAQARNDALTWDDELKAPATLDEQEEDKIFVDVVE